MPLSIIFCAALIGCSKKPAAKSTPVPISNLPKVLAMVRADNAVVGWQQSLVGRPLAFSSQIADSAMAVQRPVLVHGMTVDIWRDRETYVFWGRLDTPLDGIFLRCELPVGLYLQVLKKGAWYSEFAAVVEVTGARSAYEVGPGDPSGFVDSDENMVVEGRCDGLVLRPL